MYCQGKFNKKDKSEKGEHKTPVDFAQLFCIMFLDAKGLKKAGHLWSFWTFPKSWRTLHEHIFPLFCSSTSVSKEAKKTRVFPPCMLSKSALLDWGFQSGAFKKTRLTIHYSRSTPLLLLVLLRFCGRETLSEPAGETQGCQVDSLWKGQKQQGQKQGLTDETDKVIMPLDMIQQQKRRALNNIWGQTFIEFKQKYTQNKQSIRGENLMYHLRTDGTCVKERPSVTISIRELARIFIIFFFCAFLPTPDPDGVSQQGSPWDYANPKRIN